MKTEKYRWSLIYFQFYFQFRLFVLQSSSALKFKTNHKHNPNVSIWMIKYIPQIPTNSHVGKHNC